MAEQEIKPTTEKVDISPEEETRRGTAFSRSLLPIGLSIIALLVGCYWWGSQPRSEPSLEEIPVIPTVTESIQNNLATQPAQSTATITGIASLLAEAELPTVTPTPVTADSALVQLPTVTPTLVPAPVATRTVEFGGHATVRLQLDNDVFESNGQPVTLEVEPRSYILGGDTLTQSDQWCMQVGPTGLIFDLVLTLQPVSENLHVGGALQLYDGFCGDWGNLGDELTSVPVDVNVPSGALAQLSPTLQVHGSLLGMDDLLNISTGVFLELSIRNPQPR